jgi:hypothetical protein
MKTTVKQGQFWKKREREGKSQKQPFWAFDLLTHLTKAQLIFTPKIQWSNC